MRAFFDRYGHVLIGLPVVLLLWYGGAGMVLIAQHGVVGAVDAAWSRNPFAGFMLIPSVALLIGTLIYFLTRAAGSRTY